MVESAVTDIISPSVTADDPLGCLVEVILTLKKRCDLIILRLSLERCDQAVLAISTSVLKPSGSWIAISLRLLRFSVTPALMSPAMNFE